MGNIVIDGEFKSLLPALDKETFGSLEANIIENGCRDAIVLWNGILVDGHNRHTICTKHGIPFNTVSKDFASREEALIWIVSNQVSRRNLTPMQLSHYRGVHYRADKKIVTNADGKNQYSEVEGQNDPQPKKRATAERLSEKYRVSSKTIKRDAKVAEAIDAIGTASPEAKRKILSGDAGISKKELEELSYRSKGELEAAAAKIADGSYSKKKPEAEANAATTATETKTTAEAEAQTQTPPEPEGAADNILSLMRSLDKAVANMSDGIDSELPKITKTVFRSELKASLKANIERLEKLYNKM